MASDTAAMSRTTTSGFTCVFEIGCCRKPRHWDAQQRGTCETDSQSSSEKTYPPFEPRRFTLGRNFEFAEALFRAKVPLSKPVADQPEAAITLMTALHVAVLGVGAI
jgi:hypothetical protein